jgi:hypothetical protein
MIPELDLEKKNWAEIETGRLWSWAAWPGYLLGWKASGLGFLLGPLKFSTDLELTILEYIKNLKMVWIIRWIKPFGKIPINSPKFFFDDIFQNIFLYGTIWIEEFEESPQCGISHDLEENEEKFEFDLKTVHGPTMTPRFDSTVPVFFIIILASKLYMILVFCSLYYYFYFYIKFIIWIQW